MSATSKFCSECGQDQSVSVPQDQRIQTEDVPVPPPPPDSSYQPVQTKWGWPVAAVIILIVILAFVGAGQDETKPSSSSSGTQDKAERKEQAESKKQEEKKAAPVEEPDPINLSGVGQQATDPFELESGLAVFRMTHQGGENFIVDLLDQSGSLVDIGGLANKIGPFEGSYAVQTQAGSHVLDVQASGPWTITIDQPRPSSALRTTSFSGSSKTATDLFELSRGLKRFNMTHQGSENFIVDLLDENGARVEIAGLVNEIGPFNGSKAVQVPEDGIYLLQVEADGPWTIQVE